MTVLVFFGVDEDGAGTGAATLDVAGGAMEGGGADGAVTIGATADPGVG